MQLAQSICPNSHASVNHFYVQWKSHYFLVALLGHSLFTLSLSYYWHILQQMLGISAYLQRVNSCCIQLKMASATCSCICKSPVYILFCQDKSYCLFSYIKQQQLYILYSLVLFKLPFQITTINLWRWNWPISLLNCYTYKRVF